MSKYAKRRAELEALEKKQLGEDDDYEEYVPIKKRKQDRMHKVRAEILQEDHDIEAQRRQEEEAKQKKKERDAANAQVTFFSFVAACFVRFNWYFF